MGVLKVKQTDGSWRDVGCAPTSTTGRLKLWTGTEWVVEKCGGGSFTDDFARADSTTAVGNGWAAGRLSNRGSNSVWGLQSGAAYLVTQGFDGGTSLGGLLWRDFGTDTLDVTVEVASFAGSALGILVQADSTFDNYTIIDDDRMWLIRSGASTPGPAYAGYTGTLTTLRVVATSTTLTVYANGVFQQTRTVGMTHTRFGLVGAGGSGAGTRFNSFTATGVPTPGRPLKALISGVWTDVACMVPDVVNLLDSTLNWFPTGNFGSTGKSATSSTALFRSAPSAVRLANTNTGWGAIEVDASFYDVIVPGKTYRFGVYVRDLTDQTYAPGPRNITWQIQNLNTSQQLGVVQYANQVSTAGWTLVESTFTAPATGTSYRFILTSVRANGTSGGGSGGHETFIDDWFLYEL